MCDVEKITSANQAQRRYAEEVDARIEANRKEEKRKALEAKRQRCRAQGARVCYILAGASAAMAGISGFDAIDRAAVGSWLAAGAALCFGLLLLRLAEAWDREVQQWND